MMASGTGKIRTVLERQKSLDMRSFVFYILNVEIPAIMRDKMGASTNTVSRALTGRLGTSMDTQARIRLPQGLRNCRHHVALTPGDVRAPVEEALTRYLDFDVTTF